MQMTSKGKTLLFFTSTFPYGSGEQFIETEIHYLSAAFEKIYIYPLTVEGEQRPVPHNVVVVPNKLYSPYSRVGLLFRYFGFVFRLFSIELARSPYRWKYVKRFGKSLNYALHRLNDSNWLGQELSKYDMSSTVVYSYWFNLWGTLLCFLKARKKLPAFFVTRIHGGDYDHARKRLGYFPFRYFEVDQVNGIYPVSQYGFNYMSEQYPSCKNKIKVSRLGVENRGENPVQTEEAFHIVSCSYLIPLKRLHLIIAILKHLSFRVKWVHFGDGPLAGEIRQLAATLPLNIQWEFKGEVPNAEVMRYYREQRVDLFMNVSRFEGVPVSIMEATSFGIPATGCRTGGVPEIVKPETGFLFEVELDTAAAADRITSYFHSPAEEKAQFRKGVKQFWNKEFNSAVNYPAFIKEISK